MQPNLELRIKLGVNGALGCVGFVLSAASLYWLVRMKRTFRQQLLLLMIIVDVAKSVAYIALPLAVWRGITVTGDSKYCQFSGFLMSITVEGTDFTMVLISIQMALYVFQEQNKTGFGGLSEYRYIVYTLWLLIPALIALLAFVNPNGGYVALGSVCYLPRNPYWYRLSLAIIPRCLVFLTILIVYSAIYIYTKHKLSEFREVENMSTKRTLLILHATPIGSFSTSDKGIHPLHTHNFGSEFKESDATDDCITTIGTAILCYPPDANQLPSSFSALGNSIRSSEPKCEGVSGTLSNLDEKRSRIEKQLRLLFIYPIIYLLMWAIPMAFQVVQFIKHWEAGASPRWMSFTWGTVMAAHSGVEAIVFLLRERPWTREKSPLPTSLRRFKR